MISKTKTKVYGKGVNDSEARIRKSVMITNAEGRRVEKVLWVCPFYRTWTNMLSRCYSSNYQSRRPTYVECEVCEEWQLFSKFKYWMQSQEWEGNTLDKDILFTGNKLYSPETCVFVENKVNNFITEKRSSKSGYLAGVDWHKAASKFRAKCNVNGKSVHLGLHNSELDAHKAWLAHKLKEAKVLAAEQTDQRVAKALVDRYENYKIN